jgi:hypothetical protein
MWNAKEQAHKRTFISVNQRKEYGPPANESLPLWTFEPKASGPKDLRTEGNTVNALWSLWSDREDLPGPRSSFCHSRRYLVKSRSHRGHSTLWIIWPTIQAVVSDG